MRKTINVYCYKFDFYYGPGLVRELFVWVAKALPAKLSWTILCTQINQTGSALASGLQYLVMKQTESQFMELPIKL